MNAPTRQRHPPAYIAVNNDGTFDAFVHGTGFRASVSLPQAAEFIRNYSNRQTGCVPLWDRARQEWDSEIDISEVE